MRDGNIYTLDMHLTPEEEGKEPPEDPPEERPEEPEEPEEQEEPPESGFARPER